MQNLPDPFGGHNLQVHIVLGLVRVVSLSMEAISHTKTSSARTSDYSCGGHWDDKINSLYNMKHSGMTCKVT